MQRPDDFEVLDLRAAVDEGRLQMKASECRFPHMMSSTELLNEDVQRENKFCGKISRFDPFYIEYIFNKPILMKGYFLQWADDPI